MAAAGNPRFADRPFPGARFHDPLREPPPADARFQDPLQDQQLADPLFQGRSFSDQSFVDQAMADRFFSDGSFSDPPSARLRSSPTPPGPPPSFGVRHTSDVAAIGTTHEEHEEKDVAAEKPSMRARLEEMTTAGRSRLGLSLPRTGRLDLHRLAPGAPGLRVLVVAGLLAAAVAGALAWRSRPVAEPLAPPAAISGGPISGGPVSGGSVSGGPAASLPSPSPTSSVIVYVTGKVRKPGVLALATGSRVVDAIEAAGGVSKGTRPGGVNLARRLVDGEQIIVGDAGGGHNLQPVSSPAEGQVVNLNAATVEQLNTLPGVGDVLAQRIVEFRDGHGGFQSVDQLREVSGIGDRKFAELRNRVTV
jgi:competence protein ComEA